MIISFEGIDGSGKGTQAKKLLEYFESKNKPSILMDFPQYETPTGKKIREYLDGKKKLDALGIAKLFYEDQLAQKEKIIEMERNGIIIILDRYVLSTKVYQGAKANPEEKEKIMNEIAKLQKNLPKPDLTIVFDLPVEESAKRIMARGRKTDIHEKNLEYLIRVRNLYLETAKKENHPIIKCIEKNHYKTIEEIFKETIEAIKEKTGLIF
ncbi:MAG: dTMP kinase [Candidatus Nanoarchaeia archaeon]|nr:dTMP kinase [Candidatus Nanoarchaeia archaeon]MDD5054020.1 dTMP kinase [Candidatus Nanoarchaeia archaeon]MDD5499609.1 dTMP kinase [Candidatus Nanoarchaeia archaeon]